MSDVNLLQATRNEANSIYQLPDVQMFPSEESSVSLSSEFSLDAYSILSHESVSDDSLSIGVHMSGFRLLSIFLSSCSAQVTGSHSVYAKSTSGALTGSQISSGISYRTSS